MAADMDGLRTFTRAPFASDWEGLRRTVRREGTPDRVHFFELLIDGEVKAEICRRFALARDLDPEDPRQYVEREIELARFLGYDFFRPRTETFVAFPRHQLSTADASGIAADVRRQERRWTDEHRGPIQTWEDVERYPWPEPEKADYSVLEWADKHVPPGMTVACSCHQIFEQTSWLMGLETLCFALQDDPALVDEVFRRVGDVFTRLARIYVQFESVGFLFGGDDMGFRGGTLVPPETLREKCLPFHREISRIAHEAGRLNILHSCGKIDAIMPDLIEDVRIDGKHSFEDVSHPVTAAKRMWGDRIAVLGGIDVDFLCRADPEAIGRRVRETLDVCHPGGGYCLGSGNSIANYIPLENYLAMLAAGRDYVP
jgi:uroporphyrinogen decarboxylase